MRIPSGVTDQYIYFVAVDATDLKTREPGLTTFTVYRSRDGGVAAAMTTPTVNETDATNMPGVYELLLDEDMTIAAGNDSEEMVFHITQASMAPVTRTIELYRQKITAGNTLGVASDGDISGNVDGSVGSVVGAVGSVTGNVGGNVVGSVASVTGAVGSVTGAVGSVISGVNLAAGAITNASLAGNMEIVFETDFATNYNATRTAWVTNVQDTVGTGNLPADMLAISGDATAADNFETMLDGTGGNTLSLGNLVIAPSTGVGFQVTAASGEHAVHFAGSNRNALLCDTSAGTFGAVRIYNDLTSTRGAVDIVGTGAASGVQVTAGATASGVSITGGATSGDAINLTITSGNTINYNGTDLRVAMQAENEDAIDAKFTSLAEINANALGGIAGTCIGTPTTTSIDTTSLTNSNTDAYKDGYLIMTNGPAINERRRITASSYFGGTTTLTTLPFSGTPANGNSFVIM